MASHQASTATTSLNRSTNVLAKPVNTPPTATISVIPADVAIKSMAVLGENAIIINMRKENPHTPKESRNKKLNVYIQIKFKPAFDWQTDLTCARQINGAPMQWIASFNSLRNPAHGEMYISHGVADLNDPNDIRNDFRDEGKVPNELEFESPLSKSGVIGQMLATANPFYLAKVQQLAAAGLIKIDKRTVNPIIRTHYSDTEKSRAPAEKRGQPLDDPLVRIKVSFGKFADKHPIEYFRGQPISVIFDGDKPTEFDKQGIPIKWQPMVAPDGSPLTVENAFKCIRRGSRVVCGRIFIDSVILSQSYVSVKVMGLMLVIKSPVVATGFGDDIEGNGESVSALSSELANVTTNEVNPPADVEQNTGNGSAGNPPVGNIVKEFIDDM